MVSHLLACMVAPHTEQSSTAAAAPCILPGMYSLVLLLLFLVSYRVCTAVYIARLRHAPV